MMCPGWLGRHEELFCLLSSLQPAMVLMETGSQEAEHQMAGVSKMESLVHLLRCHKGYGVTKSLSQRTRGALCALGTFARPYHIEKPRVEMCLSLHAAVECW